MFSLGLMTSELASEWTSEILLPTAGNDAVVLLDSWGGYKKALELDEVKMSGLKVILFFFNLLSDAEVHIF